VKARPKNTCRKNASKTATGFALAADAENFTNYERDDIVAPVVNIPSRNSLEGGSTRDD
jgi:hypothetical protein